MLTNTLALAFLIIDAFRIAHGQQDLG